MSSACTHAIHPPKRNIHINIHDSGTTARNSQALSGTLSVSVGGRSAPPRRQMQWCPQPAPASQCPCGAQYGPRPPHAVAASPAAAAAARTLPHSPRSTCSRQQRSESARRAERPCSTSLHAASVKRCRTCAGRTERTKLREWQSGVLAVAVRRHGHGAGELRQMCSGGVHRAAGWRVLVTVTRLLCHRPHPAAYAHTPQFAVALMALEPHPNYKLFARDCKYCGA